MQGAVQGAVAQNWFATLALLAWPVVALWLYQTRPVNQATLVDDLGRPICCFPWAPASRLPKVSRSWTRFRYQPSLQL